MTDPAQITFIICTYNRADYLDDTLESLISNRPDNQNFELLVVDNNSSDNTVDVVKKHQQHSDDLRYIKETQQGLSHARNRGIKEAKTPYIVFLDDDIKATESLIPGWQSFFADNPNAVAAGGKNHVQFDHPRPSWMSHFLLPLLAYHDLGNSIKKYSSGNYPVGCNMGFRKDIFDQIGLFDTDLGRKGKSLNAGEEKELFKRIRQLNKDVYYLPNAFLYHRVSAERLTIDYIRKQAYGLGLSMRLRLKKATLGHKLATWTTELGKLLGSIPLGLYYCLRLNPSKATMLFKFRWWIWKGYIKNS